MDGNTIAGAFYGSGHLEIGGTFKDDSSCRRVRRDSPIASRIDIRSNSTTARGIRSEIGRNPTDMLV